MGHWFTRHHQCRVFLDTISTVKKLCACSPWVKPTRIKRDEIPLQTLHEFSKWVFMFYITIWYCAASYKERHQFLPHTRTHTHADMYMLPKAKQMSHQAHISPEFSNSQNRKHQAKLSLLRCMHTHHFHFDSAFLTYGFLSPPSSPFLSISNLRTYNKLNLNTAAAEDTKGRWESQKQSWSFEWQTKTQFLPLRWAGVSQGCEPSVGALPWSDTRPGQGEQGSDAHLSPEQLVPAPACRQINLRKALACLFTWPGCFYGCYHTHWCIFICLPGCLEQQEGHRHNARHSRNPQELRVGQTSHAFQEPFSILSCYIGLDHSNYTKGWGAFESKCFSNVWREAGVVRIAKMKFC